MYIGSVRFFKHLILTVLALLIIVPTIGFVYFAVQNNNHCYPTEEKDVISHSVEMSDNN